MANSLIISWPCLCLYLVLFLLLQLEGIQGQQSYVDNKQLDCETNFDATTLGFVCNGVATSCPSYLTFRTTPTFNNPTKVANLLRADASQIAKINNISKTKNIPTNTLLIVPVNCSCSNKLYQYNTSYIIELETESYFTISNYTYQALTTCQSMKAQNPTHNYLYLSAGMKLTVPLRCACPTAKQVASGYKYLLTYLVKEDDSFEKIANIFNVYDINSIPIANNLTLDQIFYFFTPLLVPLKSEPININISSSSPPPPPPSYTPPPPIVPTEHKNSSRKWVFVGVGMGAALLLLVLLLLFGVWYFRCCKNQTTSESISYTAAKTKRKPLSGRLYLGDAIGSLTVYKYKELAKATNAFKEANRIQGYVYRASFKGDDAAVKVLKGDVSSEINVLKQINHCNIIRLSGFCVHKGNTYLVYEYAENGSLRDWLSLSHNKKNILFQNISITLGWKERVQIAYDAADALNYLHNYANPSYIHKNFNSSNVLLDASMRAKLVNFGLARSLDEEGGLVLTRHVKGTHGYMAPEYIENGLVTPKLDVFALGIVMLELLSAKEAAPMVTQDGNKGEGKMMLFEKVVEIFGTENVREKLICFMDPCLGKEYPLDLAYAIAQLANSCVSPDPNSRPTMAEVFFTLSKILSLSLDWDSSFKRVNSTSLGQGR